jgi:hypothetical protein
MAQELLAGLKKLGAGIAGKPSRKHIHIFEYVDTSPKNQLGSILACTLSKNNQKKYIDSVTILCDSVRVMFADAH